MVISSCEAGDTEPCLTRQRQREKGALVQQEGKPSKAKAARHPWKATVRLQPPVKAGHFGRSGGSKITPQRLPSPSLC